MIDIYVGPGIRWRQSVLVKLPSVRQRRLFTGAKTTTQSDSGISTVAVVIAAISGVAALGLIAAAGATGRAG